MNSRRSFATLMLSGLGLFPATAHGQLQWRVSVKLIADNANQLPPAGGLNSPALVTAAFDNSNALLDGYGRGYRFQLVDNVQLNGVSQWFNAPLNQTTKDNLEAAAMADPATYLWRDDAINIYILGTDTPGISGLCSFPGDDIIVMDQSAGSTDMIPFHECGHYFDLCHTQGCPCGNCDGGGGECDTVPGSDGTADTLPDLACWDQDDIANWSYDGSDYADLTPDQQAEVDNVWLNIMSYHSNRTILTSDQLDHATDTSNGSRNNVATGSTTFVDENGNVAIQTGSSAFPYVTVDAGIDAAAEGDIVLIRVGTYNEPMTITKAVYLRASRGDALIGTN